MPIRLADRAAATSVSGIRKMFEIARTMKNPVNLAIGQPDFPVPPAVKIAAQNAIAADHNAYTPTAGCPELLAALHCALPQYEKEQIMVTSAVSGGLVLAYLALLNPGDEILLPDPYFVMYKQLALLLGARPVFVDTYPDFGLHPERWATAITPRTRAIVIGNPANPTGAVYAENDLRALAELARRHHLALIYDAIYATFSYDAPFVNVADFYREGTLFLGGFSKSHSMTGWRVGYAAGPLELLQTMAKFQQFTFVCAPSPLQHAAITALRQPLTGVAADYRSRRDLIYRGLLDAGYQVEKPQGAFYIFPQVPWGAATEFVDECLKRELMVVAGNVFSERDTHFRISYATSSAQLERGLALLRELRIKS
ncbi:MAG: aminotransferase class I/II-fold pyridoxal phosphate-dependent enzyme [Planctomycetota bacterium]|jgi:aspartate aminotransferase/aminotransferase|nr:aminotransferase class I/II-fold pyridoxal phosphate-dependent enzyme [Planctomycetota bacterium]